MELKAVACGAVTQFCSPCPQPAASPIPGAQRSYFPSKGHFLTSQTIPLVSQEWHLQGHSLPAGSTYFLQVTPAWQHCLVLASPVIFQRGESCGAAGGSRSFPPPQHPHTWWWSRCWVAGGSRRVSRTLTAEQHKVTSRILPLLSPLWGGVKGGGRRMGPQPSPSSPGPLLPPSHSPRLSPMAQPPVAGWQWPWPAPCPGVTSAGPFLTPADAMMRSEAVGTGPPACREMAQTHAGATKQIYCLVLETALGGTWRLGT